MIDNIDGVLADVMADTDVTERLCNSVSQNKALTIPSNSDYID